MSIEAQNLKPGDLLFQGEKGDLLAGSVIRRAWRSAREKALPGGVRVTARQARVTGHDGIPPAQVTGAGNSVPGIYPRSAADAP